LILGVGDAVAALAGRRWGKTRLPGFQAEKTVEGAVAVAAAAFGTISLICLAGLFDVASPWWLVATPALVVLFEPFLPGRWDNPSLLLSSGAGVLALELISG